MIEYITVSQFAELRGISKQAVYKQLNNQLKNFVVIVNGKKHISAKALTEDELTKVEQPKVENSTENSTDFDNQSTENSTSSTPQNDVVSAAVAALSEQLKEKDKQIAALLETVNNLQTQNAVLTTIIQQEQVLHAADKPHLLERINGDEDTPKKKRRFLWWKK